MAILRILVHIFQWHIHALEGNVNIMVHQVPNAKPEVTLQVDQYSVPPIFLPYVSLGVDGHRYWRRIITSAFVHSNISHLADLAAGMGNNWIAYDELNNFKK